MKIEYRDPKLSNANYDKLELINTIIEEYQNDGYVLTLRQLYYQLVSRDVVPNKQAEYNKLSILLKEGRMGGIVDWDAIEDRLRQPYKPSSFDGPEEILDACINQYELPRQKGQDQYLEVWVEKDALSGVLRRVTSRYHVPIMVNRGYSSASAMHDAFIRFSTAWDQNKAVKILYLGDFDPSGLDMVRDINERIGEFCRGHFGGYEESEFLIKHIALTMRQIEEFDPPPNPAKLTDPRAKDFIKEHGGQSWEVDALPPQELNDLLDHEIRSSIDHELFKSIVAREELDKEKLTELKTYL